MKVIILNDDNFRLPIFRAVTEKKLTMGIPSNLLYFNFTIAYMFIFNLRTPWILPLNIILHLLMMSATKKDPMFFDCLQRHINNKKYYGV